MANLTEQVQQLLDEVSKLNETITELDPYNPARETLQAQAEALRARIGRLTLEIQEEDRERINKSLSIKSKISLLQDEIATLDDMQFTQGKNTEQGEHGSAAKRAELQRLMFELRDMGGSV
jgi:predicted nuclease with TOPRIM domain